MRKLHLVALLALAAGLGVTLASVASAQVSVGLSVRFGPPPLRVVAVQPICPGPGYIWTPGYWGYGPAGYYWIAGTWVMAPAPGLLWTPGYWGWSEGVYRWHGGYWGAHVGFYGGVNYGFGYFGTGFVGGHWSGNRFYYNTAVWHVNEREVHTTYVDRTVVRNVTVNRVSYNGGPGGVNAHANAEESRYAGEHHAAPTAGQARHEDSARATATRNGGFHAAPAEHPAQHPQAQSEARGSEARAAHGNRGNQKPKADGARGRGDNGGRGGA